MPIRIRSVPGETHVWDGFVRLFHWATAALVLIAAVVDNRAIHEAAGLTVLPLVGLRIVWGFAGPAHARFSDFVRRPAAVVGYLRALRGGHPPRYLGHNPAGGAMVVVLLGLLVLTAGSGWLSETDRFFGVQWVSDLHAIVANTLLWAVGLHVAGVLISSRLHKENLVRAMLTGRKPAHAGHGAEPECEHAAASVTGFHPG